MPFDYYLSCLQNIKLQKNITSARGMTLALWLFIFNPHPNVGRGGTTEYLSHCENNTDENRLGHQNKWLIYWSERLCYLYFRKSQERNLMADAPLLMPTLFSITVTCTANLMPVFIVSAGQFIKFMYNRMCELWHDKLSRYSQLHCTWYRSLLNVGKDARFTPPTVNAL